MSPSTDIYPVEQMIRSMMQGRVLAFYEYMSRESACTRCAIKHFPAISPLSFIKKDNRPQRTTTLRRGLSSRVFI